MTVKIKATFSKARIKTFHRFHFKKISLLPIIDFTISMICIIIAFVGLLIFENSFIFGVFIVLCFVIFGTQNYRIDRTVRKMIKNNPPSIEPYTIFIDENKVIFTQDTTCKEFKWDNISRVCEIDECFYIYVSEQSALIFPKYLIKQEQKEELRKFFQEKGIYKKYRFISIAEKEGVV